MRYADVQLVNDMAEIIEWHTFVGGIADGQLYKKRIDMLIAMTAVIADINENEAKSLVESTYVYQDIVNENECILYDSYSANLMEIAGELTRKGMANTIHKITPNTITQLNRWMDKK